jgi:tRNA(Phe) wybutosine-synthesizing methylase Tyw3
MKKFLALFAVIVFLSSCSEYQKALKSEDVAVKFGFKTTTVRKLCRKYNIELLGPTEINAEKAYETLYQSSLNAVSVNTYNVLYRPWSIDHQYFKIKCEN